MIGFKRFYFVCLSLMKCLVKFIWCWFWFCKIVIGICVMWNVSIGVFLSWVLSMVWFIIGMLSFLCSWVVWMRWLSSIDVFLMLIFFFWWLFWILVWFFFLLDGLMKLLCVLKIWCVLICSLCVVMSILYGCIYMKVVMKKYWRFLRVKCVLDFCLMVVWWLWIFELYGFLVKKSFLIDCWSKRLRL